MHDTNMQQLQSLLRQALDLSDELGLATTGIYLAEAIDHLREQVETLPQHHVVE